MKVRWSRVRRVALCVGCGLCLLASATGIRGQTPTATGSSYQDHYIGKDLPPDISTDDSEPGDTTGLARSLRIEGVTNVLSERSGDDSTHVRETGVLMGAQWDTRNYGAWSADASARAAPEGSESHGSSAGLFRLVGRDIPFDGGWLANLTLGDLNSPDIALARSQPRFFLPMGPMEGVATEWRGSSGLQIIAGAGQPGIYEGIAVPAFDSLGGTTATAGVQWSLDSAWTLGGQLAAARNIQLFTSALTSDAQKSSSTSGLISAAWHASDLRLQINAIDTGNAGSGNSVGIWADASVIQGRVSENFGAFRLGPGLSWGNQLISNDIEGGYYQFGYQGRRWFADVGIDQAWSVSGRGLDSTFVASDARYQLSPDLGIGGVVNLRRTDGLNAWSAESFVDVRNGIGIARGQVNLADSDTEHQYSLTLGESWDLSGYTHLSASVGLERLTTSGTALAQGNSTAANLSINGNIEVSARLSIDGNLRWDPALSGSQASALMANVALRWQVARDWALEASYFENRLSSWTMLVITSPLTPPTANPVPSVGQRAGFLTIRYQRAAGQHFAPLGGGPGSGFGRLTGTLFLDANNNGRFDAGEMTTPNVTVILDGRFSTVTDSKGQFDFPEVATGHHFITVVPDNLPLPWTLHGEGRVEVEVRTRDRTNVNVAAVRPEVMAQRPE